MNDEFDSLANKLLRAGRQVGPSQQDEERNLALLRARIAAQPNPDQGPVVSKPPVATPATSTKIMSALAVGGAVVTALVYYAQQSTEKASDAPVVASSTVSTPIVEPSAPALLGTVSELASTGELQTTAHSHFEASTSAPPPLRTPSSKASNAQPESTSGSLSEEVALLSRALDALRSGRARDALVTLGEHEKKYPRGGLALERRVARVQALCQLGRKDDARAELSRLPPTSPAVKRAKASCDLGE